MLLNKIVNSALLDVVSMQLVLILDMVLLLTFEWPNSGVT